MKDKVVLIFERILIIIFLIILIFFQFNHVLWLDELDWGIGVVDNSNLISIVKTVLVTGENLPLFYIFLFIARSIFGYNEWTLTLFSSTIFTILGVIGIIKVSDKVLERKNRIFTIFYIFTSYAIISMCGWQIRPYGLLFCLSSWMLYFYLNKVDDNKMSTIVKYTISMILIMYTHWYGVLISLLYAFIDFILFLKKKNDWKFLIPYLIAGLIFLPSFILLLKYHKSDISSYGVEIPNIYSLLSIIEFLGTDIFINGIILFFGMIIINFLSKNIKIKIINLVPLLLILSTYFYSRYINPAGSIVRNRYFSIILPHSIILLSFCLIKIINYFNKKRIIKMMIIPIVIIYVIFEIIISYNYILLYPNHEGISCYKGWTEFLSKQEDTYNDKTLIICTYGKTWIDYYFKYKGREIPKNVIVVDPLKQPNTYHLAEEDIDDFEFFIKHGKRVTDKVTKEDIRKYDTIYYLAEYRVIDSKLEKYIDKYFKTVLTHNKKNVIKFVKFQEK